MGNEHGKEHDPAGQDPGHAGTGEKVKPRKEKKGKHKTDQQPVAPASSSKPDALKDIDTSRLQHEVTAPIEDYYTVTEKVLGRYVVAHIHAKCAAVTPIQNTIHFLPIHGCPKRDSLLCISEIGLSIIDGYCCRHSRSQQLAKLPADLALFHARISLYGLTRTQTRPVLGQTPLHS